jgi:hypothetical protein
MEYITVKDGKISGHFCGDRLPEGAIQVTDFWGNTGDPVTWYDDKWQRKDEIELYRAGVKELPAGYRLNDGKTAVVEMSEVEKIQAGILKLPAGMKIENGVIAVKTPAEKLADGEITQEAYDGLLKQQYKDRVVSLIREKYSANDEYKLICQRIADATYADYLTYRAYVEECKVKAKKEV